MKKIFTVLFIMMVLTACSFNTSKGTQSETRAEHNYQFIGDSKHWEAVYSYKASEIWGENDRKQTTHSSKENYVLTLKYKGSLEELSFMKNLEYTYETTSSSGTKTEQYNEPPSEKVFTTSGGSEGGAIIGEGEVIKVNVKWDDNEESFELHNKVK
ncbi:membrane lipoprotein lipid attachment site-containing protein [Bacillus sp. R1-10]